LRATVDVHIHYSFEPEQAGTIVNRWLILDFSMPVAFRPLRPAITAKFDKENLRTMAAIKQYAEAHASDGVASPPVDKLPRTASSPSSHPGA
jgi:hypothetical protein